MVHLVRKKIGKYHYLYLQRSYRVKGKVKVEHVAYLGREGKLTKKEINEALEDANKRLKGQGKGR